MKTLDLSYPEPAKNLACDEALLNLCEEGQSDEVLRFWSAVNHFIVLGYSNKIAEEVATKYCEKAGIPLYRRHSGGGTVLQGVGCLNYSLIFKLNGERPIKNLEAANEYVMNRHCEALNALVDGDIKVRGVSDLTLDNYKISGNAQRRNKHAVLMHGTFLLDFDLTQIGLALNMPTKQPCYREDRPHKDFVTNMKVSEEKVKETLKNIWNAKETFEDVPEKAIEKLVEERYSRDEWNKKF